MFLSADADEFVALPPVIAAEIAERNFAEDFVV
jgi:hypothetical protein